MKENEPKKERERETEREKQRRGTKGTFLASSSGSSSIIKSSFPIPFLDLFYFFRHFFSLPRSRKKIQELPFDEKRRR